MPDKTVTLTDYQRAMVWRALTKQISRYRAKASAASEADKPFEVQDCRDAIADLKVLREAFEA